MTLEEDVAVFAERYVPSNHPTHVRDRKIFHDALWGTFLVHKHEVALLQLPLLQRLRYLHQTGFSFLTYPSARHSRFEHTLGVMHQASRLVSHLSEKTKDQAPNPLDDANGWKLRMAALLHDCSHGPFSHTSEEMYRLNEDMQALIGPEGAYEGLSPSETLARLVLMSEPFREFFNRLQNDYSVPGSPSELADLIQGKNKLGPFGYLVDVINGPFDADKLDYIFRDSHFSGLPLTVDIDRLWYSVEIQQLHAGDLRPNSPEMKRLVISAAGVNSLEQIVFSRMGLTASFYHHHKVRAADCMFKGLIEYCLDKDLPLANRSLKSTADYLYLTDYHLMAEAENNGDPAIRDQLSAIFDRRLWKRALVMSMRSIAEDEASSVEEDDPTTIQSLIMSKKHAGGHAELRELAKRIWEEAGRPGRVHDIWIDFPDEPKMKDLQLTIVNTGTQGAPKFTGLENFMPIDQWGRQYLLRKWRGHVFCPPEHVGSVTPAAKSVLENKYSVKFNDYATSLAHIE